jgi:hypothetical protein
MPGTAQAYGLSNPFDPAPVDRRPGAPDARPAAALRIGAARARGLQRRARPGGGLRLHPGIPETQAYVAKILGLLGGADDGFAPLEVRLVE